MPLCQSSKGSMSKDCDTVFNAEASRNPLVKGEGIVSLMLPLPLLVLRGILGSTDGFLHFAQSTPEAPT